MRAPIAHPNTARRRVCARLWLVVLALGLITPACSAGTASRTPRRLRGASAIDRQCGRVPECVAYLEALKQSVYRRWRPSARTGEGTVVLRMTLDGTGTPSSLKTVRATTPALAASCRTAIGYAEPFGPLPISLSFLKDQELTLEFVYARPVSAPAPD